ncbi:hypothetical protein L1987_54876 [Smallanthus sonchifolius]|uniref:Uncharacterized protein n=1 Tax=Smallanthus sonchifolius TaxID=185202 RepID=A0ACB9E909_9ASTR|nr:hypothetical protein L1987_54876 [Smallanthus sonchifolius]
MHSLAVGSAIMCVPFLCNELQPKVVKRGRPLGKRVKKTPGRPPLDRVGAESTSGATLATTEGNTNESTTYNLRKASPKQYFCVPTLLTLVTQSNPTENDRRNRKEIQKNRTKFRRIGRKKAKSKTNRSKRNQKMKKDTSSIGEKDHSKGKKQHKEKMNKEAEKEDDGKRSGKKIETSKKGKGKEKVEEGLHLKVDSGKKRKEKNRNKVKVKRKVVEEIGFGKTLLLKLHMIPTSLGYWRLQNYDPSTNILNDGANEYKLITSLINEIFGIPNGETQVTQMSKPKTYDPVVKEWRSQFDNEMQKKQKKIYVSDLVDYLKKTDDSGRMFKLNFMVVLMSIIGEKMKSNTVRMERIEKELKKVEEHAEKLKMLFEKERKDYPSSNIVIEKQREWELLLKKYIPVEEFSKETPRIQSKDTVLLDTPFIVSQDTMSELIELEKQATKRIEEVENQKKKSESVNKNDPPSFRLLSQDSNERNPEIEIGNTENVEKETV